MRKQKPHLSETIKIYAEFIFRGRSVTIFGNFDPEDYVDLFARLKVKVDYKEVHHTTGGLPIRKHRLGPAKDSEIVGRTPVVTKMIGYSFYKRQPYARRKYQPNN